MADRKSLIEGLKPSSTSDPAREKEFVYANTAKATPAVSSPKTAETGNGSGQNGSSAGRVPLTTRVRGDYAAALKRASLERQLSGVKPNTLQDILEEALHPWLRANGYLD